MADVCVVDNVFTIKGRLLATVPHFIGAVSPKGEKSDQKTVNYILYFKILTRQLNIQKAGERDVSFIEVITLLDIHAFNRRVNI
ncbi:hypothetical protein [Desulfoluna sp.]|uniref:hypothetical protein n=1 Tax=Desulfoluna sp. TaxID=2045199 RepID=UPI002634F98E|nr:hypothetical protein [Desulfoluna sp.]